MPASVASPVRRPRRRLLRLLTVLPIVVLLLTGTLGVDRYRDDRAALAEAYDRGVEAETAGRLDEAIVYYGRAGGFRDADVRRASAAAALAPYRTAYLDGVAALDAGRYDEAIALLVPVVRTLPAYQDAAARLAEARERRRVALLAAAGEAEARGDWLTAEAALTQLLAGDPDEPTLLARLASLRRDHAPIAFTREQRLFLIGPDLTGERLVTDEVPASWPAWSPDRTRIAFISQEGVAGGNHRLYVVNADGSGLRMLADQVMAGSFWPVWSPDGSRIAYTSQAAFDGPVGRGLFSVHVVDVAGGVDVGVTGEELTFAAAPTWSPEGDRLAVIGLEDRTHPDISAGPVEVYVVHLAAGTVENVGGNRFRDARYLAWSPTDDRLLIYGQRPPTTRAPASSSIHQLDLATGAVTNVHTGSQLAWLPAWSPDGSRIAYVEGEQVVRVRTRGRGEAWINVASPLIGTLSWSPDGSVLLAAAANPQQQSFLIPLADGVGPEEPLALVYDVTQPNAGLPVWSAVQSAPIAGPPSVEGTAYDRD